MARRDLGDPRFGISPEEPASNVLRHALEYAALGWSVIPLISGSKKPATRNGFYDATTSILAIRSRDWSVHNLAIATGAGLVVLDIDLKHGAELRVSASGCCELYDADGAYVLTLPRSRIHRTPTGGWHYFGRCPIDIPSSCGRLGRGIDIKARGGYVVMPPSILDASESSSGHGGSWEILVDEDIADLPAELVERLIKRNIETRKSFPSVGPSRGSTAWARAALRKEMHIVETSIAGSRNTCLNRAAFKLATIGELSKEEIIGGLTSAAEQAGLGLSESRKTIESGFRAGRVKGRRRPATPSFDAAVFEAALRFMDWKGSQGASDLRVMEALLALCRRCGRDVVSASERQLAEGAGLHRRTVRSALKRLQGRGLLCGEVRGPDPEADYRGPKARAYRLRLPPGTNSSEGSFSLSRQALPSKSNHPLPLEGRLLGQACHNDDGVPEANPWRYRWKNASGLGGGFGEAARRVWRALGEYRDPVSAEELLQHVRGPVLRTITRALQRLQDADMVMRHKDGRWSLTGRDPADALAGRHCGYGCTANQTKANCPTHDASGRQVRRHQAEREDFLTRRSSR